MSIDTTITRYKLTPENMKTAELIGERKRGKSARCFACNCVCWTHLAKANSNAPVCALCKSCFKIVREEVEKPFYR